MKYRNLSKEEKIKLLESKDFNPEQTIIFDCGRPSMYQIIEPYIQNGSKVGVKEYTEDDKKKVKRSLRVEDGDSFKLERGALLNLNSPEDKVTWDWVKHYLNDYFVFDKSEIIPDSSTARYWITIEEQVTIQKLNKADQLRKALNLVADATPDQLYKYARLDGTDMRAYKPDAVREFFNDMVQGSIPGKNLERVITLFTDPVYKTEFLLLELIEKNVLSYNDATQTYTFGKNVYAYGKEECLTLLTDRKNKTTEEIIKKFDGLKIAE